MVADGQNTSAKLCPLMYFYTMALTVVFIVVIIVWLIYVQNVYSASKTLAAPTPTNQNTTATSLKQATSMADQARADEFERVSTYNTIIIIVIGFLLFFNQKKLWEHMKASQIVPTLTDVTKKIEEVANGMKDPSTEISEVKGLIREVSTQVTEIKENLARNSG